jgi:hypothetical protein
LPFYQGKNQQREKDKLFAENSRLITLEDGALVL